jgi:hypothetical protein
MQLAIAALLFQKSEAKEWVEGQKAFDESIDRGEGVGDALQLLLCKKGIYEGQEWMGADKFLALWARPGE